jgi:hypothetical protein
MWDVSRTEGTKEGGWIVWTMRDESGIIKAKNERSLSMLYSNGSNKSQARSVSTTSRSVRSDLSVAMPASYRVLRIFSIVGVIIGSLNVLVAVVSFMSRRGDFNVLAAGIGILCTSLFMLVVLGIWYSTERNAEYLRRIAEKLGSH